MAASAAQLQKLCERKLEELDLVAILIDGIHFGKQVLVASAGRGELLRRSLATTNPIESCLSMVERVARSVTELQSAVECWRCSPPANRIADSAD